MIISDTSPLIAFSAIRRIDLLQKLFVSVLIPPAVFRELVSQGKNWREAAEIQEAINDGTWIKAASAPQSHLLPALCERLGAGEAEAIILALQCNSPVLLDDLAARKAALGLNLDVVGSLGVLARSKATGAIPAAKPLIEAIRNAGIYYSAPLIHKFLKELGEI